MRTQIEDLDAELMATSVRSRLCCFNRVVLRTAAATCAMAIALRSDAIPVAKSDQQLLEESDLVVRVRVLAVVCTSQFYLPSSDEIVSRYKGLLQILEVKKGDGQVFDVVLVYWDDVPIALPGEWGVGYRPNEEAVTHLVWHADRRAYHTLWWNAKQTIASSALAESPKTRGSVHTASNSAIRANIPPYELGVTIIPTRLNRAVGPVEQNGYQITSIKPGSPASRFGLSAGDVIVCANGIETTSHHAFSTALEQSQGRVHLTVISGRPPYKKRLVEVVLVPTPKYEPKPADSPPTSVKQ